MPTVVKVLCFVGCLLTVVAMDTTWLYNQHILWSCIKISKLPWFRAGCASVAVLLIQLFMWLNTRGSLSFSASYSGTKYFFSSPSAKFTSCIFKQRNETVIPPYFKYVLLTVWRRSWASPWMFLQIIKSWLKLFSSSEKSYRCILSPSSLFIDSTYPLSVWSTAIPSSDAKNANLYFLDVVQQANSIFHLFDKQFNDQLMPLIRSALGWIIQLFIFYSVCLCVRLLPPHLILPLKISSSSPKLTECLHKKKEVIEQMEVKLDTGIDRSVWLQL